MTTHIRASHILVKDPVVAHNLLATINGGANFEGIAQVYSQCPSKSRGGDLGVFGRGQMVKPFEDAAFALNVGGTSGIVQTQFGFHIIKRTA